MRGKIKEALRDKYMKSYRAGRREAVGRRKQPAIVIERHVVWTGFGKPRTYLSPHVYTMHAVMAAVTWYLVPAFLTCPESDPFKQGFQSDGAGYRSSIF